MSTNALNVLTIILMAISFIGGTLCLWRACYRVLGKVGFLGFRCWRPGPISPRCKNIWLTSGISCILLGIILLLSYFANVNRSYSAWEVFTWFISGYYPANEYKPKSWISPLMWLAKAAFLGFIVTLVVNIIGLGKKE